jgi:hypothetical protein
MYTANIAFFTKIQAMFTKKNELFIVFELNLLPVCVHIYGERRMHDQ